MDEARPRLIAPDEPPPFVVERAQGRSPFFLTADHAGKLLPRKLRSVRWWLPSRVLRAIEHERPDGA